MTPSHLRNPTLFALNLWDLTRLDYFVIPSFLIHNNTLGREEVPSFFVVVVVLGMKEV